MTETAASHGEPPDGDQNHALSDLLDRLEETVGGKKVKVADLLDHLGKRSFASLMLAFTLISASPASAIPGVTALVAVLVWLLVVQMIAGRDHIWLPSVITRRRLSSEKLCKGIGWLRRPVEIVEKVMRPRLPFLFHRPILLVPLVLILALTMVMPFMEVIPTSGSIASAAIALFAAGLLTRDGIVMLLSLIPLGVVPFVIIHYGLGI